MAGFYSICVGISNYAGRIEGRDAEVEAGAAKVHRRLTARGFRSTLLTRSRATLGRFQKELARLHRLKRGDLVVVHFGGCFEATGNFADAISFFDGALTISNLAVALQELGLADICVWIDGRAPSGSAGDAGTAFTEQLSRLASDAACARSVYAIVSSIGGQNAEAAGAPLTNAVVRSLDRHPVPPLGDAFFAAVREQSGSAAFSSTSVRARDLGNGAGHALGSEPPVLDDSDVQAHVLLGFPKHERTALLFFAIENASAFKEAVLAETLPLTSAVAYRERTEESVLAAAFTHAGLDVLGAAELERLGAYSKEQRLDEDDADGEADPSLHGLSRRPKNVEYAPHPAEKTPAFASGMAYRSRPILSDPWTGQGSYENWKIRSTRQRPLHGVLVVAARSAAALDVEVRRLKAVPGMHSVAVEEGYHLGSLEAPIEHFGFRDGVAKPGVAARLASLDAIDSRVVPEGATSVFPLRHLLVRARCVSDGEGTKPNGAESVAPVWAHNGSFLVYRRLNQEVARFRRAVSALAAERSMTEDAMSALLMGRHKDGTSLEDVDDARSAELGDVDGFDHSREGCPVFSHTRKANPRRPGRPSPPLFRRGVAFGDPIEGRSGSAAEGETDDTEDRGLHFMCYQSSIERQFETVSRWLNLPDFPEPNVGVDGLLGRPGSVPRPNDRIVGPFTLTEFVYVSGGEYFFAPSLSGLRALCGEKGC